jgi:hypothetical protein
MSTVSDEKSSYHTQRPIRFQPRKATPATNRAPGGSDDEKVDHGKEPGLEHVADFNRRIAENITTGWSGEEATPPGKPGKRIIYS